MNQPEDDLLSAENQEKHREELMKLVAYRMPFGKYKGRCLLDLPEPYVVWFRRQGFPKGELGRMMALLYEIKANGLESMLRPLRGKSAPGDPGNSPSSRVE